MIFFIAAILYFISFSGASDLLQNNQVLTSAYYGNSTEECNTEFSCLNCTTVRVCKRNYYGNYRKKLDFQCSGDKPYCDKNSGTCVKTTDDINCNRSTTVKFNCSADGYYPDPINCRKYFVCIKGLAYEMDCGFSYYNAKSQNCNNENYCNKISCKDKSGEKVPHDSDNAFYGYCYNGTLIAFQKCPGKFELDITTQECEAVCNKEGLQGDPHDCTKYYKCGYEYSQKSLSYKLQVAHKSCYDGQFFDSVNLRCAPLFEGLQCESGLVYTYNKQFIHKHYL